MKTLLKIFMLSFMFVLYANLLHAQTIGNKNVILNEYELAGFDRVDASGAFTVTIFNSETFYVGIEADENLFDNITVRVRNNKLELGTHNIRRFTKLHAEVGMPSLVAIKASGAAKLTSHDLFEGEELSLDISGASDVDLQVSYELVNSTLSGAGKLTLTGVAYEHRIESSGASRLMAQQLQTESAFVSSSGASKSKISVTDYLETNTSGAATIETIGTPDTWMNNGRIVGGTQKVTGRSYGYQDTTRVQMGNLGIEVIDGDTVKVRVGSRTLSVDDRGNIKIERNRKHKFNGHWAGIELGFNGLLTPDFNMSYPKEYAYLDLRMEKSINVNLNFYEQNFAFNKSGTFGMVSGLGFSWNNYRFGNKAYITSDSAVLQGYYMEDISVRKSKITNLYLTLPLLFEVQSKSYRTRDKLHFSAGVIGGWRIRTHSKIYYEEAHKEFSLRDPVTGELLPVVLKSPGKSSRNIDKNYDSYHMRPFKLDAAVRAGWGIINLYANYSLTSLFITDRGPELYPFSVGICVTGW